MKFSLGPSFILLLCTCVAFAEKPTTCPYGYDQVQRQCYKIIDLPLNFFDAVTACDVIDGKLLQIANQREQELVTKYLDGKVVDLRRSFWLGVTNLSGKWRYMDSDFEDVIDNWNSWAANNPNPGSNGDGHNCGFVTKKSGWKWENGPCSDNKAVVCERRLRDDSRTTTWSYFEDIEG